MKAAVVGVASLCGLLIAIAPAAARDWVVDRVSGTAWALQTGVAPVVLAPSMRVAPGQTVATASNGRVRLSNEGDVMTLAPSTALVVVPGSRRRTEVIQREGSAEIVVAPRRSPRFSVNTPFMAAVVKGTRFTVTVETDATHIAVTEGVVSVSDPSSGQSADIGAGQNASAGPAQSSGLAISGSAPVVSATRGVFAGFGADNGGGGAGDAPSIAEPVVASNDPVPASNDPVAAEPGQSVSEPDTPSASEPQTPVGSGPAPAPGNDDDDDDDDDGDDDDDDDGDDGDDDGDDDDD